MVMATEISPHFAVGLSGGYVKGQVYNFHGIRKKWDGRQLRRLCSESACLKLAVGKKMRCKSHGGGRRCQVNGCTNSAVDSDKCKRHGGGKRCQSSGCTKSAVGTTNFCKMHGGGTRCKEPGCKNSAVSRKLCIRHGGGPRCQVSGCKKGARSPHSYCYAHGGGHRCKSTSCNRPARSKTGFCGKCEDVANERKKQPQVISHPFPIQVNSGLKRTLSGLSNSESGLKRTFSCLSNGMTEFDYKRQRLPTPTLNPQSMLPMPTNSILGLQSNFAPNTKEFFPLNMPNPIAAFDMHPSVMSMASLSGPFGLMPEYTNDCERMSNLAVLQHATGKI